MTNRRTMPQRRHAETFEMTFGDMRRVHFVTCGFYDDGALGEVFISGSKSGEAVEAVARDGAVLLSIALQHGVELTTIQSAITRDAQGTPSSIVGAVVDRLCEVKP